MFSRSSAACLLYMGKVSCSFSFLILQQNKLDVCLMCPVIDDVRPMLNKIRSGRIVWCVVIHTSYEYCEHINLFQELIE